MTYRHKTPISSDLIRRSEGYVTLFSFYVTGNIKKSLITYQMCTQKKGKRKVQGVPQSQTAALPRPQEEEETDKSKQAQTKQTYEKH